MLNATLTGQDDLIAFADGQTTITASFYELASLLERLKPLVPLPCIECDGTGDVAVGDCDLAVCGTCRGSRVAR